MNILEGPFNPQKLIEQYTTYATMGISLICLGLIAALGIGSAVATRKLREIESRKN